MHLLNTHILVADGHALVAETMAAYLRTSGARVSTAVSVIQALAVIDRAEDVGLVLLDLHMPDMDGVTALQRLRDRRPDMVVAILSADASRQTARLALDAGANGFLPKTIEAPAALAAIRLILAGERFFPLDLAQAQEDATALNLSQRESQALHALIDGQSNKQIAATMKITSATVALHLTNVYRKLNVSSRAQAIRRAFELALRADRRRR